MVNITFSLLNCYFTRWETRKSWLGTITKLKTIPASQLFFSLVCFHVFERFSQSCHHWHHKGFRIYLDAQKNLSIHMEIQKRIKSAIKSNKWRFYNYQNLEANLKHHLGGSKKQKRKENSLFPKIPMCMWTKPKKTRYYLFCRDIALAAAEQPPVSQS